MLYLAFIWKLYIYIFLTDVVDFKKDGFQKVCQSCKKNQNVLKTKFPEELNVNGKYYYKDFLFIK